MLATTHLINLAILAVFFTFGYIAFAQPAPATPAPPTLVPITWSQVAGATLYTVYPDDIDTTTATATISLSPATICQTVTVTATDASGESPPSNPIRLCLTVPTAPTLQPTAGQ